MNWTSKLLTLIALLTLTTLRSPMVRAEGHHHLTIEEEEVQDDWKPKWEPKYDSGPKWPMHMMAMERFYPHYGGHSSKTDDICMILLVIGIATAVGLATIIGPLFMMFFTMTSQAFTPISAGGSTIVTAGGVPAMGRRRRALGIDTMMERRVFEILKRLSEALSKYETEAT